MAKRPTSQRYEYEVFGVGQIAPLTPVVNMKKLRADVDNMAAAGWRPVTIGSELDGWMTMVWERDSYVLGSEEEREKRRLTFQMPDSQTKA